MIKRIRIKQFRGIREGELELAPLTILLGANNSGKTTVLEALLLVHGPIHKQPYEYEIEAVKLLLYLHKTLDAQGFSFLLYNYSAEKAHVSAELDGKTCDLPLTRSGDWIICKEPTLFGGEEVELSMTSDYLGPRPVRPLSKALYVRSDLIKPAYEYLRRIWPDVWQYASRVAEALSRLVHEDYVNFTMEPFHGGKVTLYAFLKDGRRVRLGDLGDGVQVLATAMLLYELVKPKLLLWDDVEAHMNPSMLLYLASWLGERVREGTQVVVSTHSLEAASAIAHAGEEVSEKEVRIVLLSLRNGVLRYRVMTLEEVEEYRRAGIDVRVGEGLLI